MICFNVAMAAPAATPAPQMGTGGLGSFMPLIMIFAVFYFLLIRPQQKKAKLHQKMLSTLKRGDKVVTSGGMHAVVSALNGELVDVEIARDVKVTLSRNSISTVVLPEKEAAPETGKNKTI